MQAKNKKTNQSLARAAMFIGVIALAVAVGLFVGVSLRINLLQLFARLHINALDDYPKSKPSG